MPISLFLSLSLSLSSFKNQRILSSSFNRGKEKDLRIKIQCDPSVPVSRNRLIRGTRTAEERLTVSCVRSNLSLSTSSKREEKNSNKKFASSSSLSPLCFHRRDLVWRESLLYVCSRDSLVVGLELGNGETVMK